MINIDVEIYLKNIVKFFKENPNDLLSLVPIEIENEFYDKIKLVALQNTKDGLDAALTKKQLIEICVELNKKHKNNKEPNYNLFQETKFGNICLN